MKSFRKSILILTVLAMVYGLGLAVRRVVLSAQLDAYGADLPFTLESALQFRYVRMIFDGTGIPVVDYKVQAPEGVRVRETYTIGAEYLYGWAARLLPERMSLTGRVRWIAVGWFCLGIPFLSLWLWWWLRSIWAAALGGAYYAVGLAAVMRSTGQELSHENFAIPLLLASWAFGALAERANIRPTRLAAGALSAFLLAWALTGWDLIQYYVIIWAVLSYLRMCGGKYFAAIGRQRAERWTMTLLALLAAGLVNCYLRSHAFWRAPAMLLVCGTLPGIWWQAWSASRGKSDKAGWFSCLLYVLPVAICGAGFILIGEYGDAYGHFGELLSAKLRFFNQKPADPPLLTFAQRILWVPGLNSVNFSLTKIMFPATIPLILWAAGLMLFIARIQDDSEIGHLLFYFTITALAFWLFMRFHVFLAPAAAALIGWLGAWCARRRGWLRTVLLVLILSAIAAEAAHTVRGARRWGAHPAYLDEQRELLGWLNDNIAPDVVLANFGLSAFLLAYGDFPVVLHPKFETAAIRRRVEEYGTLLFKGREIDFRDWADEAGARYYVYSLGEFAGVRVESQMRYFVDALDPPAYAPARIFEYQPLQGRYFVFLWGNHKYRVFRIITRGDEDEAGRLAGQARDRMARGNHAEASIMAQVALLHDPNNIEAAQVILKAEKMRH